MERKQGEVFKDGNVTLKVETGCNCALIAGFSMIKTLYSCKPYEEELN